MLELLVVLGILVVLGALIFASLRNISAESKSVRCLANVRTYGQAVLLFIADNNGTLPNRTTGTTPMPALRYGTWVEPYLSMPLNDLRCPLKDKSSNVGFSYTGNGALTETFWTLQSIPAPLSRVVLASEMYHGGDGFWVVGHFNRTIWGNGNGGVNPEDEGSARKPQYHGEPENRGLNMFFLDGSAKLVRSTQNNWAEPPTFGDATNGGYFYTITHFDRMMRGKLIVQ